MLTIDQRRARSEAPVAIAIHQHTAQQATVVGDMHEAARLTFTRQGRSGVVGRTTISDYTLDCADVVNDGGEARLARRRNRLIVATTCAAATSATSAAAAKNSAGAQRAQGTEPQPVRRKNPA
ncbi:hypothetical protein D3C71_1703590 [compost metagenome]